MVKVSTQTTAARTAARRAVNPSRCSDRCSTDSAICRLIGSTMCSAVVRAAEALCAGFDWRDDGLDEGLAARPRRTESPAFPGRDAGERRFGSGRFASGIGDLAAFPVGYQVI